MALRTPEQYNWEAMEFNENLMHKNFTHTNGRRIEYFTMHHMIILNRDMETDDANQTCKRVLLENGTSAHYGVDGDFIDQFVWDDNIAWGNGHWDSNTKTIVVEHANATLDEPGTDNDYVVDDRTFFNGARLIANGHHAFGLQPRRDVTLRRHHEFSSTACPGPYMIRNYGRYFDLMHDIYNEIKAGRPTNPDWEPQHSIPQPAKVDVEHVAREVINGIWGVGQDRINRLSSAGYIAAEIQRVVDDILTGKHMKTIDQMVREVIQGFWGVEPQRSILLRNAGFDPEQIQRLVNMALR